LLLCVLHFLSLYFVLAFVMMTVLSIVFLVFSLYGFGVLVFYVEFILIFSCSRTIFDVAEENF
jgi:hypothetical protein